jgi:hypothetical protein
VQVDLSEVADGTLMVLSHTGFATAEDAANHQLGWDPQVERLTALLLDPVADRG